MSETLSPAQIQADYDDYIRMTMQRKPGNQPSNWASSIGHACNRHLYYLRVEGARRLPPPVNLLRLFRAGNEAERRTKADLMSMGYNWHEEQSPVAVVDLELFGRHDGYVSKDGSPKVLTEIKSLSGALFARAKGNPDYILSSPFFRKGVVQFNSYLTALNESHGFFIYRNRDNDDLYVMNYKTDAALWSETSARLKLVNDAVLKQEPPPHIAPEERADACGFCQFQDFCLPDIVAGRGGVEFWSSGEHAEAVAKLDRLFELKSAVKEHDEINNWRKATFENMDGIVVGRYLIEGKQIAFTRKPQEEKQVSYWKGNISIIE